MPHFHDENPWKDRVIYVPLDELAEVLAEGNTATGQSRGSATDIMDYWHSYGTEIDAYILPGNPSSIGVRFGPREDQYLCVFNSSPEAVDDLIAKHSALKDHTSKTSTPGM